MAAWGVMALRLGHDDPISPEAPRGRYRRIQYSLVGLLTTLAGLLFVYRAIFVNEAWRPLSSHVDGLLLIAALLSGAVLFLQTGRRLPEFSGFALPILTVLLAWAICASSWTFEPFEIGTVWKTFHLASVYLGVMAVSMSAVGGGMYLYLRKRLHRKADLASPRRFGSLEATEGLIRSTSILGFVMITLALITGLVIQLDAPEKLGKGWWYSSHIVLPIIAWVLYALLINVRHSSTFRGARAAWLSIAGLVLLLVTLGVAR